MKEKGNKILNIGHLVVFSLKLIIIDRNRTEIYPNLTDKCCMIEQF